MAYWAVLDYIKDDISDDTVKELVTAFDGAALHGWENGDNIPKLNRIKKALFDVLGDEDQTEKAFACIAKHKYNVTFEAETPEKQPDSLSFHFGKDKGDEWASKSDIVHDFALAHHDCSFALGNAVLEYLDEKQHSERNIPELKAGWYKKTDFSITAVINGEEFNYDGRFDIGDGKGTGGGSLIDHIRTYNEGILGYTQHPFNQPEYKERAQRMLDIFVPLLEKHSELTAEEQRIFDDFKAQHPIRTYEDADRDYIVFQIYQLPDGEKYHGIHFENMEQLKKNGVQLNYDDYTIVYEGELAKFKGNATLEALFAQFNNDRSDAVSNVIVIHTDGKDTTYFCDSFGFTEMPEFFREKELVQEKPETAKVSDLVVGDTILYEGKRREVENISDKSIFLKDLDAPDYGGILLGTSDVLAYDGWQQDMEKKGFEILSKAEKLAPVVDTPEQAEPEDKGPVSLRKVGDFYEMYGKNAEIGAEVLGLRMLSKNGQPMVGFPAHVKDEYSAKLREAGYTVLLEQAFELNPPKREAEKLQTLQQVVDKFFGTDCESAETERGTWKLAIADGDKVGELFYGGEPVCGIYNRGDKMEIEPYRELTTFPALLRTAMLEHNPDKPVEIMDFQRTFENELKTLSAEYANTVYEMQDKIKAFPMKEEQLTTALSNLQADRKALKALPIDPETKLPIFKMKIGDVEYTDKKEAAKALEEVALSIRIADTLVKVGEFQGFPLSITVHSPAMGGGMTATIQGEYQHSAKLISSFAHNMSRIEAGLYNIDRRIDQVKLNLSKLRVDYDEAQKIVSESFLQQAELEKLTTVLNLAAIEAKKNAPKREQTCYFQRAQLKREAARIAKKKSAPKKTKAQDKKKPGLE